MRRAKFALGLAVVTIAGLGCSPESEKDEVRFEAAICVQKDVEGPYPPSTRGQLFCTIGSDEESESLTLEAMYEEGWRLIDLETVLTANPDVLSSPHTLPFELVSHFLLFERPKR